MSWEHKSERAPRYVCMAMKVNVSALLLFPPCQPVRLFGGMKRSRTQVGGAHNNESGPTTLIAFDFFRARPVASSRSRRGRLFVTEFQLICHNKKATRCFWSWEDLSAIAAVVFSVSAPSTHTKRRERGLLWFASIICAHWRAPSCGSKLCFLCSLEPNTSYSLVPDAMARFCKQLWCINLIILFYFLFAKFEIFLF